MRVHEAQLGQVICRLESALAQDSEVASYQDAYDHCLSDHDHTVEDDLANMDLGHPLNHLFHLLGECFLVRCHKEEEEPDFQSGERGPTS